MEKVMYSLAHKETGELIKYMESGNDGQDFCNNTTVELSILGDTYWLVDQMASVQWVKYGRPTPWYNSSIDNPKIGYRLTLENYEPVKVVLKTERLDEKPDFICLEEGELEYAVDYNSKTEIITEHQHKHLVVWVVNDSVKYADKIGVKVKDASYSYRILVWAGEYMGKQSLILSNDYYE